MGLSGQPLLTVAQFQAGLALLEQDLANGIIARLEVDYEEVFAAALELSRKYGQTTAVKTADLMHVAIPATPDTRCLRAPARPLSDDF